MDASTNLTDKLCEIIFGCKKSGRIFNIPGR